VKDVGIVGYQEKKKLGFVQNVKVHIGINLKNE